MAARLNAREIEQSIRELEEPQAVAMHEIEPLVLRNGERRPGAAKLALHLLQRTQHEGERRAKLMADIGEKCRLGPVEFGERFRAATFLGPRVGIGNRRRNLSRDKRKEASIVIVKLAHRAQAYNQSP